MNGVAQKLPGGLFFRRLGLHAAVTPISLQPRPPDSFGFPAKRLRKIDTKSGHKCMSKMLCKTCGKHVYLLRIRRGEPVQNAADFLRGTGGFVVDKWLECPRASISINR